MYFSNRYFHTQLVAAVQMAAKTHYDTDTPLDCITCTKLDDPHLDSVFMVLEGLRTPITALIAESTSEDCDKDAKHYLDDKGESAEILTPKNSPFEEEGFEEGLFVLLDQNYCYFITNSALSPKPDHESTDDLSETDNRV